MLQCFPQNSTRQGPGESAQMEGASTADGGGQKAPAVLWIHWSGPRRLGFSSREIPSREKRTLQGDPRVRDAGFHVNMCLQL